MSRIGKMHIDIPAGVEVKVDENNLVTVKGPKGELKQQLCPQMAIEIENNRIEIKRPNDEKETRSLHGLTRALLNNMVVGVTHEFSKELNIVGVGYKAAKQGKQLVLNLGYSHQVIFDEPEGITFEVPQADKVIIRGANKQVVGQLAAEIRAKRPPEPYLGKGVKYSDETIRRKAGKTGK
ncbi:MAG: 50S ribosomal protein L6 [Clostridia bacterium]|nr:50S ribosomal protein L6 [Clostridia bacterium]MBQ6182562.1 50S ribosomal protein L6 [Clostridia bacterium]